jgi:hypothetical protein
VTAESSEHLALGWGIHRCVGLPLAQLELRVAVEEIFAATDWITLTSDVEWVSLVDPHRIPCTSPAPAIEDQDPYPERTVVLPDPDTMTAGSGGDAQTQRHLINRFDRSVRAHICVGPHKSVPLS